MKIIKLIIFTFLNLNIMGRILKSTVENKIKKGYEFRFGDYISEGFEIFKKEWVNFFLYAIVSSILLGIASITIIGVALYYFQSHWDLQ